MRAEVLARRVPFRLAIILKARKPNVVAELCLPLFQPPDVSTSRPLGYARALYDFILVLIFLELVQ